MNVDYNDFAKKFSTSRKSMKWEEIAYFFENYPLGDSILDIGCGSGRLLEQYKDFFGKYPENYLGVDLSYGLLQEARFEYPEQEFIEGDMRDIDKIVGEKMFDSIFLIASFHHLRDYENRKKMLQKLTLLLSSEARIFMTHWALDSQYNQEKYKEKKVSGSDDLYGSSDYCIYFGETPRYYHSFSLKELEILFTETGYTILENRLFENDKNIISILK